MRTRDSQSDLTGGRRWTAGIAAGMLVAWRKTGLSLNEFARERGVGAHRLYWWRKRLAADTTNAQPPGALLERTAPSMAFVPAMVTGTVGTTRLAVRLPGGVEVEAADVTALPVEWVVALARELGRRL